MATETNQKEMFERIENVDELRRIWTVVLKNLIEIQAKIGDSERVTLKPIKVFANKLYTEVSPPQDLSVELKQEIIGQFSLAGDKHFFQSQWSYENKQVAIGLETAIYKLQRRQNYRLKVPDSFSAHFKLLAVNGKANGESLKVYDLSAGGCCLLAGESSSLSPGDLLRAELELGRRNEILIEGLIKHVRTEIQKGRSIRRIGIQFKMTPALDSQLFTVMMELSRKYLKA